MANQTLIGFVGKRRSGKDTAAGALVAQGFEPVKFAGALKAMLKAYFLYVNVPPHEIDLLIEGQYKEIICGRLCGKTPRWAMQSLGTEWGRNLIGERLWVDACVDRCLMYMRFKPVVVTDARFENEVAALQGIGGKIIRITRPGSATDDHESERYIDTLPADFEITNDSTIDELHAKVLRYVNQHE